MPAALDLKRSIEPALAAFASQPLREAARGLWQTLGYQSSRTLDLAGKETFRTHFDPARQLHEAHARWDEWQEFEFLFQLADDDIARSITAATGGALSLFESSGQVEGQEIHSFLLFAIRLSGERYTRTDLVAITRAVNRLFSMPALLLFLHGETLSMAVVRRRLGRRDPSREVLEKVTLIKDVRFADPLRAHIEILHDLSLPTLHAEFAFHNFVGLHAAWEKRLDTYQLNERFYRDIANWYFWALDERTDLAFPRAVEAIPRGTERGQEARSLFLIRLLTRLIFCWFLLEKGLLPRALFSPRILRELLRDFAPSDGNYYRAILQNLFFATLNQEMPARAFRHKAASPGGRDAHRGATNLLRHAALLRDPEKFLALTQTIPFLNGGLFECLDLVFTREEARPNVRLDDFSEEKGNALHLPNDLFFGAEQEVDLSGATGLSKSKRTKVRGLIAILSRYKFTVEENTPLEEEIALDPELLGKVFENLLASYNEDTRTTARKATGAFYTPREIVAYMVDETLRAHLGAAAPNLAPAQLAALFAAGATPLPDDAGFSEDERRLLIAAIDRLKILDPACGSGAFPMGALHRLVELLARLDPGNARWKAQQLAKARQDRALAARMQDDENRENSLREIDTRIADIERSFDLRFHALDFARKLYLIENCIFGVDVNPIACQIAKLRCFIALIVDQKADPTAPNLGVRPLPNLETRIVAADALRPIERRERQGDLLSENLEAHRRLKALREELAEVRHQHFAARSPERKARCRQRDGELRAEMAALLPAAGYSATQSRQLAAWDPYDQNAHAPFFDSDWMFGLPIGRIRLSAESPATLRGHFAFVNEAAGQMELAPAPREIDSGFDIVLGNPPYVRIQTLKAKDEGAANFLRSHYVSASKGNFDLYVVFVEAGLRFLRPRGRLAYILPHKFFNAQYGEPLRALLAKGRHLEHVVHFGDQQVFPGATNYVCLLFLSSGESENLRFVKVKDLPDWLVTLRGQELQIPAKTVTSSEWNYTVGGAGAIMDQVRQSPKKVGQIANRIAQGIRTSANEIYVLDVVSERESTVVAYSKQLQNEVELERRYLQRFLQGREIKKFEVLPSNKVVIVPYRWTKGRAELVPLQEIQVSAPKTYDYLLLNKAALCAREYGRMDGPNWHAYIYPKNIDLMLLPKLLVPDIADHASFAFDDTGTFAFTSGYAIELQDGIAETFKYVLALANSSVLDFFWRQVSTPLRGGYYRYFTQFIEQLPIPTANDHQRHTVESVATVLLKLKSLGTHAITQAAVIFYEQLLNGLVYELFFREELHTAGVHLFRLLQQLPLPDAADAEALIAWAREGDATSHPFRGALFTLSSLETVRIIEGRE